MGELTEQLASGGPDVMEWENAVKRAPYLTDLVKLGAEPLRKIIDEVYLIPDREIPHPHKDYGHVVFSRHEIKELDRASTEELSRHLAAIVEGEFSLLATVPLDKVAQILTSNDLKGLADRMYQRELISIDKLKETMKDCLVWEIPRSPESGPVDSRIVVLTPENEITGGDLSTLGERLQVMWFGCNELGRFNGTTDTSTFKHGHKGHIVHAHLRKEFIEDMDNTFGVHRAPILFGTEG